MRITNKEFLDRFSKSDVGAVILPQEKLLIEKRLRMLDAIQAEIVKQKADVSGGDDWHDGAFRATDNEAKIVVEQAGRLGTHLKGLIVDYPESDEERATLGSRVTVNQSGDIYDIEIVGVPLLHEGDDDIVACSIESPLAQAVIGHRVGQTALFMAGGRQQLIELISIDQSAMQQFLHDEIAK